MSEVVSVMVTRPCVTLVGRDCDRDCDRDRHCDYVCTYVSGRGAWTSGDKCRTLDLHHAGLHMQARFAAHAQHRVVGQHVFATP